MLPTILSVVSKTLVFLISSIFTLFIVAIGCYKQGWAFLQKKSHKYPEKLLKDYNHKTIQLSDIKLHYVEAGDPKAPLMVLVHGFPEFWYSWRFQIKHFAKTHHVVAIDQRGYGDSDKPQGVDKYTVKLLAKDVREVIEKLGYKKAIIAGHDWGAIVCWYTALYHPEAVDKLIILNAPHPGAYERVVRAHPTQLLKSWYIGYFQSPFMPEMYLEFNDFGFLNLALRSPGSGIVNQKNFTDEDLEAFKAAFSANGSFTGPINYYRSMMRDRHAVKDLIKQKAKPDTLIIWGENDAFLNVQCAEFSKDLCENGKVEYVTKASHWVQQDEPEKVNELMDAFLSN